MNLEQIRDLLATAASYDGRSIDRRVIEDWAETGVAMLPPELAIAAVRAWYTENRGYIQPRDVIDVAVKLQGLDVPDTVTARRLAGRALPFGGEPLAEPLNFERKGNS